ncbi:MAG: hypothetical protein P8046_02195 [Anaerolineales bacterium]
MTIQQYPKLELLPADKVCLHEHHDPQRTEPLKERIKSSGILNNPPLVIPFTNGEDGYMVLDGANRVTSLKELGLPHILVQIVDPNSPGVSLQTWNHVLWDIAPENLLEKITALDDLRISPIDGMTFKPKTIAVLQTPDKTYYAIESDSPKDRSQRITNLVDMYSISAHFDRTMIEHVDNLDGLYQQLAGLIIYPLFDINEVINFCRDDKLLPAGITRFIVSPRALRVKYPLEYMDGDRPLEEKRTQLKNFIQERMNKKGVRIYTETTVLYDE